MDDILKANLDALLNNASKKDDWDFCILITGSGRVRVGKSVLGMQISTYWTYQLEKLYGIKIPFSIKENIVFIGSKLIEQGNKLGEKFPKSVLMFDEAGADLESMKIRKNTTQAVKDFLRECGQYNFLTILILPEFFDLPKGVALSRSDFLIDCYVLPDKKGKLIRGYFNCYNRQNKKFLYLKGKKELNYKAYKYNFHGKFYNFYPIDENEYRKAKMEALKQREEGELSNLTKRHIAQRDILLKICRDLGLSQQNISDRVRDYGLILPQTTITDALEHVNAYRRANFLINFA